MWRSPSSHPRGSKGSLWPGFGAMQHVLISIRRRKGSIKCGRKDKVLFLSRAFFGTSSTDPHPTPTHLLAPWVQAGDFSGYRTTERSRLDCGECKPGMFPGEKNPFFQLLVPQRIMYPNKVDPVNIPQQDNFYAG